MTELPTTPAQAPPPSETVNVWARPSRRKRAILAGLLSLLFAGMGQLYNRQPRKALAFAAVSEIPGVLLLFSRVLFSFWTMLAFLTLSFLWRAFIIVEAVHGSGKLKRSEPLSSMRGLTYALLGCVFFLAAFFPTVQQIQNRSGFGAFKVPSASMCPTICAGERIVADMHAYRSKLPQRGDLVLVKIPADNTLLIKRVVGVSGDVVAPGAAGAIMVNGRQFSFPAPCSAAPRQNEPSAYEPMFPTTTIPRGSYFVVGDNLPSSFDSRYPEFGNVTEGTVEGRPLYLYWSPAESRIGCSLH